MRLVFKYCLVCLLLCASACSLQKQLNEADAKYFYAPKANIEINIDGRTIAVNADVSIVKDSLIAFSLSLVKGWELYRIEVDKSQITVYDRVRHKYAQIGLNKANMVIKPRLNFRRIQQGLIASDGEKMQTFKSKISGQPIVVNLRLAEMEKSTESHLKPIRRNRYEKTKLEDLFNVKL